MKIGLPATPVEAPLLLELADPAAPMCEEPGSPLQPGTVDSNTGRARQLTSRAEGTLRAARFGCIEWIGSDMGCRVSRTGFIHENDVAWFERRSGTFPRHFLDDTILAE